MQPCWRTAAARFVRGDVLRLNELFDPLADADGVFAVAGIMATTIGENPWMSLDVNIRGFQNALEACRYQGVKKVVFSSSVGVYGAPEDDPTDETRPCAGKLTPPAMVALLRVQGHGRRARAALSTSATASTSSPCATRPSTGSASTGVPSWGGTLPRPANASAAGSPPIIDGDGRQVQDYVYAGDVARANLMAMESPVTGEGINICSGVDTSQNRIVEIVAAGVRFEL